MLKTQLPGWHAGASSFLSLLRLAYAQHHPATTQQITAPVSRIGTKHKKSNDQWRRGRPHRCRPAGMGARAKTHVALVSQEVRSATDYPQRSRWFSEREHRQRLIPRTTQRHTESTAVNRASTHPRTPVALCRELWIAFCSRRRCSCSKSPCPLPPRSGLPKAEGGSKYWGWGRGLNLFNEIRCRSEPCFETEVQAEAA